ncbi:glycoside hydrolase family 172 protein [Mucilaginibacter pedocola]|uniref:DUF2961 domain-containing protein n=1 Tax=Mucilaginibacter pedocola TaxID=1792845 RepID=A0A1S9PIS2_9SPHI|nr:glycoside hydrolase family 172 protein [Mucilaginibacter pedocola]OOQ60844.1 hypothetical protein BC343_23030 [Mucilaginibacter pedocola]
MKAFLFTAAALACLASCTPKQKGDALYSYNEQAETRWSSPENFNGQKGQGGKENNTAKGHPADSIPAGAAKALLDIQGEGVIKRIWVTINDRSPQMLRGLKIEMFWDGETKPAVSAPFGDFFGAGLAKTSAFENELFANPEGRSFICYIPMPFKTGAKIVVTNESGVSLHDIYFDVDYLLGANAGNSLYFHTYWHRDTSTMLAKDFELLPRVEGKGRFLGVNIGVNANPQYRKSWFGEGEVKMFVDDDKAYPTLNGTGTEDYIGTGWGQGKYITRYSGCTIASDSLLQWAFYRYHVPDPVFFKTALRITMQQIGGAMRDSVMRYQKEGAPLIPVTISSGKLYHYYKPGQVVTLNKNMPDGWTNFYRRDDIASTAYFYLDKPANNLPAIQPAAIRKTQLREAK